jgi:hypothetical protein
MRLKLLKFLMILSLGVLGAGRIGPVLAASVVPGGDYQDLRGQLLAEGWKPDASYGQKLSNGKPFHRFPEVLCGMDRCRAKWRDSRGAERAIMLQRGGPSDPYRVTGEE